jgi:ABC-type Na+ efflux pump permease subunit
MLKKSNIIRFLWLSQAIIVYFLFNFIIPHKYINNLPIFFALIYGISITLGLLMSIGNYKRIKDIDAPDTVVQFILTILSFFIFMFFSISFMVNFSKKTDKILDEI